MKNLFLGLVLLAGTLGFANTSNKTVGTNNTIETTVSSEVKTSKTYVFDANDTQGIELLTKEAKEVLKDVLIIIACDDSGCLIIVIVYN